MFSSRLSSVEQSIERLSMTFTANGKRPKWNFGRLSSAVCTVEWNYLYLQWVVGDVITFCGPYLRIRRKDLKIRSCLCRLPSAVNVMFNLSIIKKIWTLVCLEIGRARSFDATKSQSWPQTPKPTISLRIRKHLSWSVAHIETAVLLPHHNLYCRL